MLKLFLLLFTLFPLAQIDMTNQPYYSYIMEDSLPDNLDCYISVSKERYSVLLFDHMKGSDIVPCMIISQGKIYKKGNQVIMKDNAYGYEMNATLGEEGLLTINRGYGFLSGKHFLFHIEEEEEWVPDRFFSRRSYHASFRKYKRNHKKPYALPYGRYSTGYYVDHHALLTLEEDGSYSLQQWNMDVSKGKFHREGNILVLTDSSINHPFYLFIGDGFVRDNYMPTSIYDMIFYPIDSRPLTHE